MFPFRPRLNHLRTDRLERRLRQRLHDAGIPTAAMVAAAEMETALNPALHPLLVSLQHVRLLLIHLRHLLIRQRVGMILGAGDSMFVWNRREPSIPTGQRGEGDSVPEMDMEVVRPGDA